MGEKKLLNGLEAGAIESAMEIIRGKSHAPRAPKTSKVRWIDALQFEASVRNHTFLVDEPTQLAGKDESPNSVELVLGAYGTCVATGFVWNATRRGIAIHSLEIELNSTQDNSFTFLGIDPPDKGHAGLDYIKVKLIIQADADDDTIQELWDHTLKTSPVGNTFTRTVKIEPELEISR